MSQATLREQTIAGSHGVSIKIAISERDIFFRYGPLEPVADSLNLYIALGTHREMGAAILPFAQHIEGSTVFLSVKSDLLLSVEVRAGQVVRFLRRWERWRWGERQQTDAFAATWENRELVFRLPRSLAGESTRIDFAMYAKDPSANNGWGWFWGCSDHSVEAGIGDKYIPHYHELQLDSESALVAKKRRHHRTDSARVRIYQLFVRLFGNTNETRQQNGTLAENGAGRFADINDAALSSLRQMGFTHIWLTGVLRQATATDYSEIGQPADDTDLLKGLAGSPYAIKDYFDVCPDYAQEPADRLREFEHLLQRLHAHELKAIIDLVANHVARSCDSRIKPACNFGSCDDASKFFDPNNNFFYLTPDENGPPLRLPTWKDGIPQSATCQAVEAISDRRNLDQAVAAVYDRRNRGIHGGDPHSPSSGGHRPPLQQSSGGHRPPLQQSSGGQGPPLQQCDGLFAGETTFGRVTGNNVVSWTPHLNDWYETVKLNYGFDFTDPSKSVREYPNAWTPEKAIPDTWIKMDQIIAYWQSIGVDGFRCDMSHMVPPEFWSWIIAQARSRQPDVVFLGEAYDDDPSKVPGSDPVIAGLNWGKGNVMFDLLNAGFDAVYDAPVYRALKRIYDGSGWANDIDREITDAYICHNSVRYAENHDEVRLAAAAEWGGIGMEVGRPVSAILYGLSRGAIMLYNGQEVGEPAAGAEGFAGEDGRTSIFDYWSMPELVKWVNGHQYDGGRLSSEQKELRAFYARLINLVGEPAFQDGEFFPLNPANRDNPEFGRLPGEQASGHWLYAFLRYNRSTQQRFLVLVNLHPKIALQNVRVFLPGTAMHFLDLNDTANTIRFSDRLDPARTLNVRSTAAEALGVGIPLSAIPPLTSFFFELTLER